MNHSLHLNAFTMVRPRGVDMPSAPVPRKTTNTSSNSAFGSVKTLDARGRQTVSLKHRVLGAITIESREQSAASVAKRRKISKGGTK